MITFNDFINENWGKDTSDTSNISAGIVLLYNNKILLIHPTNSSWVTGTCGIPKGKLEKGEDPFDGAIREFAEETGIVLTQDQISKEPYNIVFYNGTKKIGQLIYFICKIDDLSEIGITSEKLSSSQLQLSEVDWGKFVGRDEAYSIISPKQLIILDRHLSR